MNVTAFLLSLIGSLAVLATSYVLLRGTVLDISHLRANPWPLMWYHQMFLTLIPLIVVGYTGIENMPGLRIAQPGLEIPVATSVISSLLVYVLSLAFFLRVFGLHGREVLTSAATDSAGLHSKASRLSACLSIFGLLLLVAFHFLGYRHAFLFSVLQARPLLRIRLENVYASRVPTQLSSLVPTVGTFLAILAGRIGRRDRAASLRYLAVALFILTAPGDKALLVWGVLLWILAKGKLLPQSLFSMRVLRFAVCVLAIGLGLSYLAVSVQTPNMSAQAFKQYLLLRLGVAQMNGTYETAGLIENGYRFGDEFGWHAIPFASIFVDYTNYHKHLMMISEGYAFDQMGVMNTFFLAEAYAMGGPRVAYMSPLVVAFSTSLGLLLTVILIKLCFGAELVWVAIPLYLRGHGLTGGFDAYPLLKGWILLALQLGVLCAWWLLFKFLVPYRVRKA